jgi:hypothetical protein
MPTIGNAHFVRIADHQASLQVVGFSSPRSVKKPIGALAFWSFFAKKKGRTHHFSRFSTLQDTPSVRKNPLKKVAT